MTAKEYLGQAYRLDQRINANLEEVARLREMASSVSSPSWEEKAGGSRPRASAQRSAVCVDRGFGSGVGRNLHLHFFQSVE